MVKRAGLKTKPKKIAKIITYTIACIGTLLFGCGMILSWSCPETFHKSGGIIAIIGLLILAITPPLYRFVFSKLIKRHLDKLIKLLEE